MNANFSNSQPNCPDREKEKEREKIELCLIWRASYSRSHAKRTLFRSLALALPCTPKLMASDGLNFERFRSHLRLCVFGGPTLPTHSHSQAHIKWEWVDVVSLTFWKYQKIRIVSGWFGTSQFMISMSSHVMMMMKEKEKKISLANLGENEELFKS